MRIESKTVVNILGVGRSGTTMLDLMLGNGKNTFSAGEVSSLYRPWRKHHFAIDCSCGNLDCDVWNSLKSAGERSFHAKLFQDHGVETIIDSSKELYWLVDVYKWLEPEVRIVNVVIWKDFLKLAYSHWKRGEDVFLWKNSFMRFFNRFLSLNLPFVSLSLDTLASDPAKTLQQLCEVISLPYFKGKEQFWLGEYHYLFGSPGVRKQVNEKKSNLYIDERFPPEFRAGIPEIEQLITEDKVLSNILHQIKEADIFSGKRFIAKRPERLSKPAWYHVQHFRKYINKIIPENYTGKI